MSFGVCGAYTNAQRLNSMNFYYTSVSKVPLMSLTILSNHTFVNILAKQGNGKNTQKVKYQWDLEIFRAKCLYFCTSSTAVSENTAIHFLVHFNKFHLQKIT